MTERIAHDHPTVETVGATVIRDGPTTRPIVEIDADLDVPEEDIVRVVIGGTEYRAQIEQDGLGIYRIRHVAETPNKARNTSSGENKLQDWVKANDLPIGRTVLLDIVEPGYRFGLRSPGEKAVYHSGRPDESLAAIAQQVDRDKR